MRLFLFVLTSLLISSCSPPTPEELAKNSCDCFAKAKSIQNTEKKIEALNNCYNKVHIDQQAMKEIEQDNNMNPKQVNQYEERYDRVYNKCDN